MILGTCPKEKIHRSTQHRTAHNGPELNMTCRSINRCGYSAVAHEHRELSQGGWEREEIIHSAQNCLFPSILHLLNQITCETKLTSRAFSGCFPTENEEKTKTALGVSCNSGECVLVKSSFYTRFCGRVCRLWIYSRPLQIFLV